MLLASKGLEAEALGGWGMGRHQGVDTPGSPIPMTPVTHWGLSRSSRAKAQAPPPPAAASPPELMWKALSPGRGSALLQASAPSCAAGLRHPTLVKANEPGA